MVYDLLIIQTISLIIFKIKKRVFPEFGIMKVFIAEKIVFLTYIVLGLYIIKMCAILSNFCKLNIVLFYKPFEKNIFNLYVSLS